RPSPLHGRGIGLDYRGVITELDRQVVQVVTGHYESSLTGECVSHKMVHASAVQPVVVRRVAVVAGANQGLIQPVNPSAVRSEEFVDLLLRQDERECVSGCRNHVTTHDRIRISISMVLWAGTG